MAEIIPAINASDFAEVQGKIKRIEPFSKWVHLDIANGTFAKNTLWNTPEDLFSLSTPLSLEVHMMIANPAKEIDRWIRAGAQRLIVHVETIDGVEEIKQKCDAGGVELMLSAAPETDAGAFDPYFWHISKFQILSVHPGLPGQEFIESGYEKIRALREKCPGCDIEVDGGVKVGIAKKCRQAGANLFVAASAIFGKEDIAGAIEELKQDIL